MMNNPDSTLIAGPSNTAESSNKRPRDEDVRTTIVKILIDMDEDKIGIIG